MSCMPNHCLYLLNFTIFCNLFSLCSAAVCCGDKGNRTLELNIYNFFLALHFQSKLYIKSLKWFWVFYAKVKKEVFSQFCPKVDKTFFFPKWKKKMGKSSITEACTPQPMEIVSTPWDIEEMKQYKNQETFHSKWFQLCKGQNNVSVV